MAEQVMRGSASMPIHPETRALRRKCSCEGSGEPCDNCETEQKKKLQRKEASSVTPIEAPPVVHDVLRSPGQPLDAATRSFMEPRFGQDFSHVRIHTDALAQESARAVNALAYTTGRDLVFARGQYAPHSNQGRSLLAHELSHVLQQGAAGNSGHSIHNISASAPKLQRQPGPGVHSSPPAGVPHEKYSLDAEVMYRRAGLVEAANAVRRCREGDCAKVLTEAEAYHAYESGWGIAGLGAPPDKESTGAGLAAATPLAAGGLVATAPASATSGAVAKTAVERAAQAWGVEAETVVVPEAAAPAAAPGAAAVGTVAVPVALGVYLVVATADLFGYARFQAALQRQGYVILPHPLQVCIAGCHQPSAPTFESSDTFPRLGPSDTFPRGDPFQQFPKMDEDTLRKWMEPTSPTPIPFEATRKRTPGPQPTPQTAAPPQPKAPPKSDKCSDEVHDRLYRALKKQCKRVESCSMQGDTCGSATAKVAALNACLVARVNFQQKCFSPAHPEYEGHMIQIAQLSASLRECEMVMMAKCT